MNIKRILLICATIVGLTSVVDWSDARVITNISVNGKQRIDIETIKARLPIKEGDDINDNDINEAIKSLYGSGLFDDVKIKISGQSLIVDIKEAPIINKISFEGNKKIKAEDLKETFPIKEKEALSPAKIKACQVNLLQSYCQSAGIYNARVNPKVIKLPNNQVNLVFEIDESRPAKISQVVFYGNKKISSYALKRVISSRPSHWYRFMAKDDIYNQERVESDKTAIVNYYKEHGFAQAQVESVNVELKPNIDGVIISFKIREGDQFKFGDISVKSTVNRINDKTLNKKPKCKKGSKFNNTFVTLDTAHILRDISKQGFSAVKVEPCLTPDVSKKTIDVRYDIKEGEKRYISKIVIKGNNRTRDYVILKELLFEEGDIYNKALITLSEANIQGTGFFSSVHIDAMPDPMSPDKCILVVSVEEVKTGELSLNGGYNSTEGPFLSFGYNERNFFGTGKAISLALNSSREQYGNSYKFENGKQTKIKRKEKFSVLNSITASVTDPHMFASDVAGTLSFFKFTSSPFDTFSIRNIGTSIGVSYPLTTGWTQSWELSTTRKMTDHVVNFCSPLIKYQVAPIENDVFRLDKNLKYYQYNLMHTIGYSTHVYDGFLRGDYGVSLSTSLYYSTNTRQFALKNILSGSYIRPIGRSVSLKLQLSGGMLNALGDKPLDIADSFTNSASSVRGFSEHSIGVWNMSVRRYKNSNNNKEPYANRVSLDATGAKKFFNGSAELVFPVNFASELDVKGFLFIDMGYYWSPIVTDNNKVLQTTKYSIKELDDYRTKQTVENTNALKEKRTAKTIKQEPPSGDYSSETVSAIDNGVTYTLPKRICEYESNDSHLSDAPIVGHKVFNEKLLRVSVGFGISFVLPIGLVTLSWGFPIHKGKYDAKEIFNFGMKTVF